MKEFIYRKGDVFLADLGIPHGSEQGGRRPVVIIQNDDGCVYSPTVTMVSMTTAIKKPFQKSHYILRYSDCIRYADDCVIAVKSESSAKRVMRTVTDRIQRKLGLKVNMTKTHITTPGELKYLGFGFYNDQRADEWKCKPHQDSVKRFKSRLNELTCRKMPGTVTGKIRKINQVTRGWINYYALGSMKSAMTKIDAHLRTRLRIIIWKQWKVPKKRQWGLQKLGIGKDLARVTAYCGDRYYWVATKTCVSRAISKEVLAKAGLISCADYYNERHALKLR